MDNSLILSHLPTRYSHHSSLTFIKERGEPPSSSEIADVLCANGCSHVDVWTEIDNARRRAENTARALTRQRIFAVNFWSMHFPHALRWIEYPPWNIFFVGEVPRNVPTLAVVGTRRPNDYGTEVLSRTLPELKTRPMQIVSGLAYGVDSLAHFYACEAGIPNFAVLGCGVDILYPAGHALLASRIVEEGGGLLSEFPPGTAPLARHFPWRNRIISGLADIVWVVQGTARSGSLHTAVHAGRQAKTLVATPGDIFSELSEVPNRLLFDGAQPILRASDLDMLLEKPRAILAH